jgi:hypothetical protein
MTRKSPARPGNASLALSYHLHSPRLSGGAETFHPASSRDRVLAFALE